MESLFSLNSSLVLLHFPTSQQHTASEVAFCFSDLFAQLCFWNYIQNKQGKNIHGTNHQKLRLTLPSTSVFRTHLAKIIQHSLKSYLAMPASHTKHTDKISVVFKVRVLEKSCLWHTKAVSLCSISESKNHSSALLEKYRMVT